MDDEVVIAPASPADVPAILSLIRALADYEKLTHQVVATEALLREHLFGSKRIAEALVAKVDGVAVGFALFFTTFSTFLARPGIWLEDLFVVPELRGRGIGKMLLMAVARIAVQREAGRLEWSVLDWNTPSIEFYERQGATVMPDWRICRVTGEALQGLGSQNGR